MSKQTGVGGCPAPQNAPATPQGRKSGPGVWKIWVTYNQMHTITHYKTKNLRQTLQKLLADGAEILAIRHSSDYYYYLLNNNAVQELLSGQSTNAVATLEPPYFTGCKAYMYVTLSPQKLFEVRA
jgi:hypothetical protein